MKLLMSQIIDEYVREIVALQKAQGIVDHVENAMKNATMMEQEACKLIGVTRKSYEEAKELLVTRINTDYY